MPCRGLLVRHFDPRNRLDDARFIVRDALQTELSNQLVDLTWYESDQLDTITHGNGAFTDVRYEPHGLMNESGWVAEIAKATGAAGRA